jgi:integrase
MPKTDHRKNLTPTLITGLKRASEGKRYQIMDAQVPGFGVRVTDRGHKTFILRTRFPGSDNPSRRELGSCSTMTLAAAREKARKWRTMVGQGLDPGIEEERERQETLRRKAITFEAVVGDFISQKLPNERKGKDVEREIRRDLMPRWKDRPIASITDIDILIVIKAKVPDGRVGARNLLALVKRFFQWVIGQRIYGVTVSPCASLRTSAVIGELPGPRDRVLTDEEIFACWRAACRTPYPYGPLYKVLMLTALRLNEVAEASWTEFDLKAGIWTIPAERMKGRNVGRKQARQHTVPLTPELIGVLKSLPRFKDGDFLFSTTFGSSPVWMGTKPKDRLDARMRRTLRALAWQRGDDHRKVDLPHFVQHDIRRTVRSQLSRLKIAEEVREALLAHARPGIKGTYDWHHYLDEKREALREWHARLGEIIRRIPDNAVKLYAAA